jgi:hypothetical protein
MLRQRLQHKQELFDVKVILSNWWLPMCKNEDVWDELIGMELGKRGDTVRWVDAIRLSEWENYRAYEKDLQRDRDVTTKMQRIVDEETKLALEEGQTIVRGRKRHPIRVMKPKS